MAQNKTATKRKEITSKVVKLPQSTDPKTTGSVTFHVIENKPTAKRGRPPLGPSRRIPKLIQLDPRVDSWIAQQARSQQKPYQSVINDTFLQIIENHTSEEQSSTSTDEMPAT